MSNRFAVLLVVLFACLAPAVHGQVLSPVAPEEVGLSPERLERLDRLVEEAIAREEVAGAVVLVARHGDVAYHKAFGDADREAGRPMQTDAIFRIASMSKAVTTVAAMMLFEEGRLRLDDPVSAYIPAFRNPRVLVAAADSGRVPPYELVPAKREVTVEDLLTHTSGLTYGFYGRPHLKQLYDEAGISDGLTQTEGTICEMAAKLGALPLYSQPGEAYEYGLSTDVLGCVVEVASGQPLDVFFRERIFEPLGMTDTHFFLPAEKVGRLARVYTSREGGGIEPLPEEEVTVGPTVFSTSYHYEGPRTYFSGGAGLASTAMDYARFLQMLLNGGELGDERLLSRKTVELMTTNRTGDLWKGGQRFGYGFWINVGPDEGGALGSAGAYGWGGFFNTTYWVDPVEEIVFVAMTQRWPGAGSKLLGTLSKMPYQAIED